MEDDQDVVLNGQFPMKKTRHLIADKGIQFDNMFVTSPLCCPSRSSILSGRYIHNGGALNNSVSGNCNGLPWQHGLEKDTFVTYLQRQGYETFFAGKYLNQYGKRSVGGVKHVPPGWDHWNALVGNSRYYNYTLSVDGQAEHHGDDYKKDYLTDVISRKALMFLENRGRRTDQPFFMMLSTPACHANFTPAPQYKEVYKSYKAPRCGSFNVHGKDKHWLIRAAKNPLSQSSIEFLDDVFRKRWRTLLSVDDMVEQVVDKLTEMCLLDNTYIIFTSDNGFHLGQFSLPIDKRQLYEFDVRVPLWIRGPGIQPQIRQEAVLNIDLGPTFIELVGLTAPLNMDGRSFVKLLLPSKQGTKAEEKVKWRNSFLIEHVGEYHPTIKNCPQYTGQKVADCHPECVCEDSKNNTYSCLRVLNATMNIVYCQFLDTEEFREFYNLTKDPYQLTNLAEHLNEDLVTKLDEELDWYRKCQGRDCM